MAAKKTSSRADPLKPYRFKPGQSGNLKGRPKRKSLEAIVEEMLDKKVGTGPDAITRREAMATVILDEVINRKNTNLTRAILERVWPATANVNLKTTNQGDEAEVLRALESLSEKDLAALAKIEEKMMNALGEESDGSSD